jgi:ABC-type Mn2+/Zn2+ transport system permease subunit
VGAPFRKVAILICFLLLLAALVASESKTIDEWIVILVWSAFLIGSVILIVKNARQPPKNRGFHFGQVAVLPRSWQRWILGEERPSKTNDHHSADKRDAEKQ